MNIKILNLLNKYLALPIIILMFVLQATASISATISDTDITLAVQNQIAKDPGADIQNIDVTTALGIVSLSGIVDNMLTKERAIMIARTVKGVRSVIDRIAVIPPVRSDKEITEDIEKALILDPINESWDIHVSSQNGRVTLQGKVNSWVEKKAAARIAKGVKGVASLQNNLDVFKDTDRPDSEMQQEIEHRLFWDALVDETLIDVEVSRGKARLTGTVGSAAERRQAHNDAWVEGISAVDTSGLEVDWWQRDRQLRQQKYTQLDNSSIRRAVKDALLFDPRVNVFDILVQVNNGLVTLSGDVDNLQARRSAIIDARNTAGVRYVKNLIKVTSGNTLDDSVLADSIKDALIMDSIIEQFGIKVSVKKGVAYLSGEVDSYYEKARADHIASGIKGISEVHNNIMVISNQIQSYSPYLDPWYTFEHDRNTSSDSAPAKSDNLILQDINDQLFWSPFVDSEQISVTVDGGVATLTGTVDSWFEYNTAKENALEGGAVAVKNKLTIAEK